MVNFQRQLQLRKMCKLPVFFNTHFDCIFHTVELMAMTISLVIANSANALKCTTEIRVNSQISLDPSVFADVWTLIIGIMLILAYALYETQTQSIYIYNRLIVLCAVIIMRTLIYANILSGCKYTPMFVYVIVVIPIRVVHHSATNQQSACL